MVYNGKTLILDNFRKELSGYSVDIQDIVRSAILDGVDISEYIDMCRQNPYRLEQIRLGMKENISNVFFKVKSGECLYLLRKASSAVRTAVEGKLIENSLSDELVYLLIDWAESGYNFSNLNISTIPRNLYPMFEKGLQLGLDMKVFNDARNYSPDYMSYCIQIMNCGKKVDKFLGKDFWNTSVLRCLAAFSKVRDTDKWDILIEHITPKMSEEKVKMLISCVKSGINISNISKEEWSSEEIGYVLRAYSEGLDYVYLINSKNSAEKKSVKSVYDMLALNKSKRVSGRFRKG